MDAVYLYLVMFKPAKSQKHVRKGQFLEKQTEIEASINNTMKFSGSQRKKKIKPSVPLHLHSDQIRFHTLVLTEAMHRAGCCCKAILVLLSSAKHNCVKFGTANAPYDRVR